MKLVILAICLTLSTVVSAKILPEEEVPSRLFEAVEHPDSFFSKAGMSPVKDDPAYAVDLSWPERCHIPVVGWIAKLCMEVGNEDAYEAYFYVESENKIYEANCILQILVDDSFPKFNQYRMYIRSCEKLIVVEDFSLLDSQQRRNPESDIVVPDNDYVYRWSEKKIVESSLAEDLQAVGKN